VNPHGARRDPPPFPTRRSSDLKSRSLKLGSRDCPSKGYTTAPASTMTATVAYAGRGVRMMRASSISYRIIRTPRPAYATVAVIRSEEHTSELQSRSDLVCRLLL